MLSKNKIAQSLSIALESVSAQPVVLEKISQDDFDDGVQTLALHYSDGSVELVKREWPEIKYRNGDDTTNIHELFLSSNVVNDPKLGWELIQRLSRELPNESMEGLFGPTKKPDLRPTNVYSAYKKTYLDKSWLDKQKYNEVVSLSKLASASVLDGKFSLANIKLLKKAADDLMTIGYHDAHNQSKNQYFEKLNDVVLKYIDGASPQSLDKIRQGWREVIRSLIPKALPNGLVLKDPLSEESFDQKLVATPESVPALTPATAYQYAKLADYLGDVVESFEGSISQFNDGGIDYGWENHTDKEDAIEFFRDNLKSEMGYLVSILETLKKAVSDLLYLIDEYLHKSIA